MARPSDVSPQIRDQAVMLYAPPYSMSFGEIGARLGLTKGQVAGLIHRAAQAGKVKKRFASGIPAPRKKKPAPVPAQVAAPTGPAQGGEPAAPPGEQGEERVEPAPSHHPSDLPEQVTVFRERKRVECQWPTSNGRPWTFCCAPSVPGRPYCEQHMIKSIDRAALERRLAKQQERAA